MHSPYTPSAASLCLLGAVFATTALSLGSVQMVNYCPEYVLYSVRIGSGYVHWPETLDPGQTYSLPFSEAQPQDPAANHTLSFDVWPAYSSDKKMRSVRRELNPYISQELDFGFKFVIWDVTVTEKGVAYGFEDQATDPFPRGGWTWKLASGDESCTPCTTLGCSAEGCSPQEDIVMEFCGSNDLPQSISLPALSATTISFTTVPVGSATPVAPSATRSYPQYTTPITSATAPSLAGSLFPHPSGSGAVLPSGGGYNYRPSPLPAAFTGAASKLQEGYIGVFALVAGLMML